MISSFCKSKTSFRIIRISLPYVSLSLTPSKISPKVYIIMYKMRCILKFYKCQEVSLELLRLWCVSEATMAAATNMSY